MSDYSLLVRERLSELPLNMVWPNGKNFRVVPFGDGGMTAIIDLEELAEAVQRLSCTVRCPGLLPDATTDECLCAIDALAWRLLLGLVRESRSAGVLP